MCAGPGTIVLLLCLFVPLSCCGGHRGFDVQGCVGVGLQCTNRDALQVLAALQNGNGLQRQADGEMGVEKVVKEGTLAVRSTKETTPAHCTNGSSNTSGSKDTI
jgi:hypothetical protein